MLLQVERGARGALPELAHLTRHELPSGSLTPCLGEPNFKAPAEVSARIGRMLAALPNRKKLSRISLVLPDACARVIILDIEKLPTSRRQAEQMIRWQVRKRVPFTMDEARMAVQRFPLEQGGERVVVVLGLEKVLSQYEQVVAALGFQPGLVDLSTFNMANLLFLEANQRKVAEAGDVALLNVADEEFSILILRRGLPLFYRSKPLIHKSVEKPVECRRDIKRELISSSAYYRDRLEGSAAGIGQAWLRTAGSGGLMLDEEVQETLGVKPRRLDAARTVSMGTAAGSDLLEMAAPALGITAGRWV